MNRLTTLLVCSVLVGCGSKNELEIAEDVIYLPYFDYCEDDRQLLSSMLSSRSIGHDMEILKPSLNPHPKFKMNSLLELRYNASEKGRVVATANRYLSDCGPSRMVEVNIQGVTDDSIRRIIKASPGGYENFEGYHLQITGDAVSIFY